MSDWVRLSEVIAPLLTVNCPTVFITEGSHCATRGTNALDLAWGQSHCLSNCKDAFQVTPPPPGGNQVPKTWNAGHCPLLISDKTVEEVKSSEFLGLRLRSLCVSDWAMQFFTHLSEHVSQSLLSHRTFCVICYKTVPKQRETEPRLSPFIFQLLS